MRGTLTFPNLSSSNPPTQTINPRPRCSILTSPTHGLKIVENAIQFLRYGSPSDDDGSHSFAPPAKSGSEVVGELEKLSLPELISIAKSLPLVKKTWGTKSTLILALALHKHKSAQLKSGELVLENMLVTELLELKVSFSVSASTFPNQSILTRCFASGCTRGQGRRHPKCEVEIYPSENIEGVPECSK